MSALARTRKRCRAAQCGAALLEFALIGLFAALPLALGVLQTSLLLAASDVLHLAAFNAVRAGANAGASRTVIERRLADGLVALYAGASARGPLAGRQVTRAWATAFGRQLMLGDLRVNSPSLEQFALWGVRRDGHVVIPNEAVEAAPLPLQQANVLGVEVMHCQQLVVPLIPQLLLPLLLRLDTTAINQRCYAAGGLPLHAEAHLPMQSDARRDLLY